MMRAACFTLCVAVLAPVQGQNLVPNGSFEEYTTCPDYFSQWARVVDWTSPYTTSADYFNACAGGYICSVPFNQFGYQQAFEGSGYMGLATVAPGTPFYREVIATELTEPLVAGVPVCVSFQSACGGYGSDAGNSAALKARGPGLRFFMELPSDWSTYLYPNSAAVYMDTVLADTANWIRVSGVFVPDSAYRYIAIANFFEDSLSWPSPLEGGGGLPGAYAFVDDVRISPDLTYCTLSAGLYARVARQFYVPDVFGSSLLIRADGPLAAGASVVVFDALSRVLVERDWPHGLQTMEISTADLSDGFYTMIISGAGGAASSFHLLHLSP